MGMRSVQDQPLWVLRMKKILITFYCLFSSFKSIPITLESITVQLTWETLFDEQAVVLKIAVEEWRGIEWIGIGFSDHGKYNNSDLCVFTSEQRLLDHFVDDSFNLRLDRSQDCELMSVSKTGFALKRRFATCDSRDYAIEQGTTQFIVMASVKKLAEIATVLDPAVEKNIGFGQVIASDSRNEELVDQEAFSFQITAKEFAVPSDETTYWCIVQKMPEQVAMLKHHAIKMEAIVQDGNEHLVHHMEIFHCEKPQKKEYEGRCRDKWRPRDSNSCNRVIAAWAKGAQAFIYPPEAGLPLGGRDSVPYIMVEIHYNNEKRVSGVVDSSGFKFTVTPNLRANDAGIMEIGLIYSDTMSIPPQQRAFPLTAFCPSACTKLYPDEGINIFGSQLHAHLTGRKLWTSIYRKGVKIGEINRDNHYSPHWQHIQKLEPSIRVRRGDVLMTTCVHETIDRKSTTFGGYSIIDEMCVNYLYYYPQSVVNVCKSSVNNDTLARFFQLNGVPSSIKLISERYDSIEWNGENVKDLMEMYSTASLNMHCLQDDGTLFKDREVNWSSVWRPRAIAPPFDRSPQRVECPAIND